jgi:hypothetical protein
MSGRRILATHHRPSPMRVDRSTNARGCVGRATDGRSDARDDAVSATGATSAGRQSYSAAKAPLSDGIGNAYSRLCVWRCGCVWIGALRNNIVGERAPGWPLGCVPDLPRSGGAFSIPATIVLSVLPSEPWPPATLNRRSPCPVVEKRRTANRRREWRAAILFRTRLVRGVRPAGSSAERSI